jgi:hypothetical protein
VETAGGIRKAVPMNRIFCGFGCKDGMEVSSQKSPEIKEGVVSRGWDSVVPR